MYVIVEIQGQQFKVVQNQKLYVHHLQEEDGDTVVFTKVLLISKDEEIVLGTPFVEGAKVEIKILQSLVKGDKVLIFHKKRRKGHRKLNTHRQYYTLIEIRKISYLTEKIG